MGPLGPELYSKNFFKLSEKIWTRLTQKKSQISDLKPTNKKTGKKSIRLIKSNFEIRKLKIKQTKQVTRFEFFPFQNFDFFFLNIIEECIITKWA